MSDDFATITPEIMLVLGAVSFLMWGAFGGGDRRATLIVWAAAGLMAVLGFWIALNGGGTATAFGGSYVHDDFARFAKTLLLLSGALILLLGERYLGRYGMQRFEYPVLILLAMTGMLIMASASDMIVLFMGLELQSLALYVIAAMNRGSVRSTEAGLKVFVLGALSSAVLLYGVSLVYGYAGTTRFEGIADVIAAEGVSLGLTFGLVFLCAALAFKVSAAPFHMWTPDVYEGSPTPVTALFATAPKIAAGILFARVVYDGFGSAISEWQQVLVFVAIASMFLGSIAAIGQTDLKRLLAYSSIGHTGFALVGLSAGTQEGAEALLIYLTIYLVMNVGVFAFILTMERDGQPVGSIRDLAGLASNAPAQAMAVSILMLSLAGLPPLAGFFGKFFVFKAAVDAGLAPLALAGATASVIAAYYYLNIVKIIYIDPVEQPMDGRGHLLHGAVLSAASIVVATGWLPFLGGFGVPEYAAAAAGSLLQ
ncbi:MAG: NADH-quinone oxidoreductase subunit NuoN [Pseudomonadota bacterium]